MRLEPIVDRIFPLLVDFPAGVFIRLGGCSWKDATSAIDSRQPSHSKLELMSIMRLPSERITRHLRVCLHINETPWLHIREWQAAARRHEYRCVMNRGRFLGGVQNRVNSTRLEEKNRVVDVRATKFVRRFFASFKLFSHLSDVIFDVYIEDEAVKLIELNPFMERTDLPGFYWHKLSDLHGKIWCAATD
jgi:hypothetical protein